MGFICMVCVHVTYTEAVRVVTVVCIYMQCLCGMCVHFVFACM